VRDLYRKTVRWLEWRDVSIKDLLLLAVAFGMLLMITAAGIISILT
jgi:hypothetical protein